MNPFFLIANPKSNIAGLPSHIRVNPSSPVPVATVEETETPAQVSCPTDLHLFITEGHCYDKAGDTPPVGSQIRMTVPPTIFNSLESSWVKTILTLIHSGARVTVDVSCCSWIDRNPLPDNVVNFLEFAISRNGTVRFSDFALTATQQLLDRIGLSFRFKVSPDLHGPTKLKFDPERLKATGLVDLSLLADLAMSGEAVVTAMPSTRRISVEGELPSYANPVILLEDSTPAMIILERPGQVGRVVLFSCHFSEMHRVHNVDLERVASAIRMLHGEKAAEEFLQQLQHIKQVSANDEDAYEASAQVASIQVCRLVSGAPCSQVDP